METMNSKMPYIPPHLRPGYIPGKPIVKHDFTGKVHWPTNMDKTTNIIEAPELGIVAAKSALKMAKSIKLNNAPILRPSMILGKSKFNNAVRRHVYKEMGSRKRISRRRSMDHKRHQTRKRRTY